MAIDGSIIQFRDELNGNATVYPLTCQSAVLGEDSQPLQTYITEYNVSHHHTNNATSQSNPNYDSSVFTLNEAIATVPIEYRRGGLKLSFNSVNGGVESYTLDSSVWKSDPKFWKRFDAKDFDDKLTELGQKVDDVLYTETVIVSTGSRTGYLNSSASYIADENYEILSFPVPQGGKIHVFGKIDKSCRAIFSNQPVAISAEAFLENIWINSLNEETDIDVKVEVPEYTGQVYARVSKKKTLPMSVTSIDSVTRIDKLEMKVEGIEDNVTSINSIIYGEKKSIIYPVSASTKMNEQFNDARIKKGAKILFSITTENQDAIGKSFNIYVFNNGSYTPVKSVKMPCSDVELLIPTLTSNSLFIQSVSALSTSASSVEVTLVFKPGVDERLKNLESETSYIYVAPNGSDEIGDGTIENPYATIFHANEMITDNSEKHRYIIKVADGTYTDLQVRYAGVSSSTYQGVVAKNFVTYEGNVLHPENVILKWDGSTGYSEPYDYDTMFFTKCLFHVVSEVETTIKGFTFDAKNTRYALHIETSGAGMGSKWEVSDCIFNWHGVPTRPSTPTIGTGSGFFEKGHLLRCRINNDIANIDGWRNHDSNYPSSYDVNRIKEGAEIVLESCDFGNSSILWRTLSTSNSYNGYNRCVIKNCIGIKTLSHLEASGVSNSWRARVECSDIETNNFSENEMY